MVKYLHLIVGYLMLVVLTLIPHHRENMGMAQGTEGVPLLSQLIAMYMYESNILNFCSENSVSMQAGQLAVVLYVEVGFIWRHKCNKFHQAPLLNDGARDNTIEH